MRPIITPRIHLAAALGALVLIVAACSSSGATSAPSAAAPSTAASAAAGGTAYIVATGSGTVGAFLTGEAGKTLYRFTPDSANTSTCVDACAKTWPPFTIDAGESLKAGDGVTGTLTTFARPDGSMQVAYNGVPLYYYTKDTKAGDTTGQGVGGKWFIASPSGAVPSPSGSGASKGNY